jgi:anti-anti-sigma factor
MEITLESGESDAVWLRCGGAITQNSTTACGDLLRDHAGNDAYDKTVIIDLSETSRIDSSGVSWLLTCQKRCREHGGRFILHSLPPDVSNVLKVLRLDRALEIAANRGDVQQLLEEQAG